MTPRQTNILNMFEPTILPIAMPVDPLIALVTETASSGRLVPIATTVNLMMRAGTFSLLAIELAPVHKKVCTFNQKHKTNHQKKYLKRLSKVFSFVLFIRV